MVSTAQIDNDAVTNAKLANMAAATFKGRAAGAGTGDPTDLTAAQAKMTLAISRTDVSGLGTLATLNQVGATQISDDAVTNAKLANMAAATFKGRAAGAGTGDPADLTAAQAENDAGNQRIRRERARRSRRQLDQVGSAQIAAGALDGKAINMQDQLLSRAEIRDFAETTATPSVSGGSLTLDLQTANVFVVTLTENVSTLALSNAPPSTKAGSVTLVLKQDATGNRTLSWPASVKWSGGNPRVVSTAANAVDVFAFFTTDGGTTWYGFAGGNGFS